MCFFIKCMLGGTFMMTELRYCSEGDYIKANFLGNRDPEDPNDLNWHNGDRHILMKVAARLLGAE